MKHFLEHTFRWDSPGKGAFESLVLLLLGFWILGTCFVLSHGIFALVSFVFGIARFGITNISFCDYPWQLYLLLLFFLTAIYSFLQHCRFWSFVQWKTCSRPWWKIFSAAALLWLGTAAAAANCIFLFVRNYYHDGCALEYLKLGAWSLPFWMLSALMLLLAAVLVSGKLYALTDNYPFRENFTLPVKILAGISIAFYAGLIVSSSIIQRAADAEKVFLAKQFGRPLNAESLQAFSNPSGKADEKYWQEVASLCKNELPRELFFDSAEFPAKELAAWRKNFISSAVFARLSQMSAHPLPPYPRKFRHYCTHLEDHYQVRIMAKVQAWKIRFALEKNDRNALLSSLQQLDHLSAYLGKQPFLISASVKFVIENMKIKALENALAQRILNKDDLLHLKQQSITVRKNMASLELTALWSELVCGIDFLEGYFTAERSGEGERLFPLEKLFFILPHLQLIYESNRLNLLRAYRNADKFHDLPSMKKSTLFNYWAIMMMADGTGTGNRFLKSRLQQQAIEFFIDQELYRLEHGKLPNFLPLPVDPFSQSPMKYTQGEVTLAKELFGKGTKEFTIPARQLTSPSKGGLNVTVTIAGQ